METHLSPLITCMPGLISNATDESKGYLLEVWLMSNVFILFYQIWWLFYDFIKIKEDIQLQAFTEAFRDCNVDCKLILPYLDAMGEMLLSVGALLDTEHKFLLHVS